MPPSPEIVEAALVLGIPLALLVGAYAVGNAIERRDYRSIRHRERELMRLPAVSFRSVPEAWEVEDAGLVTGNVVVSLDYFKRFLAGLRMVVGGRVKSYESILDRARREALLRLKEAARDRGYAAVVNVRLETARIANARREGQSTAGLEILAYGTGLVLRRGPL